MTKFALVVAATDELGIGLLSNLPWRIPKDMAFFKKVTTKIPNHFITFREEDQRVQNTVIMGRVTWESIPPKFRPLDDRFNIVVSRNPTYDLKQADITQPNTILVDSLEKAFDSIPKDVTPRIFVIGGAQMYKLAIQHANCSHIVLTRIRSKVNCDTFFPDINEELYRLATHDELEAYVGDEVPSGIQKHKEFEYEFTLYVRK